MGRSCVRAAGRGEWRCCFSRPRFRSQRAGNIVSLLAPPSQEHGPDRAPSVYPDAPKRSGPLGLRNASVPLNRRTARLGALHLCAGCGRMGAHWKSSTQPRPPCGSGVLISAPVLNRARCATWKATAFASSDKLKRIIGTAERRRRRPDMCLATPVVTGGGNV